MKEQFVTYEIALKLKELGFDSSCFSAYTENGKLMDIGDYSNDDKVGELDGHSYYISCLSPLLQQAIDWFREKYNIHIYIDFYDGLYGFAIKLNKEKLYNRCGSFEPGFKNYPEAREQAILKAIELCKKQ